MLINFVRAIILYIVVLIVMRLMGKREIGQLQPFELAIAIMIADLASIPMTETGIPIFSPFLLIKIPLYLKNAVLPTFTMDTPYFSRGYPIISAITGIKIFSASPSTIIIPLAKNKFAFVESRKRCRNR